MSSTAAARLGWAACAVSLVVWALHVVLAEAAGIEAPSGSPGPHATWDERVLRVIFAGSLGAASVIGALIIARHPGNVIGWIIATAALLSALSDASGVYATSPLLAPLGGGGLPPGAMWVAWAGSILDTNWVLVAPLLLLFPDGKLPSERWRPVLWLAAVSVTFVVLKVALVPGPLPGAPTLDNPAAVPGLAESLSLLGSLARICLVAAILLSAAALVLRFRHARGDERLQLKLVVTAASIWVVTLAVTALAPPEARSVVHFVYAIALGGFVLSFGLAILKYRLYDVDVVISRTLVYGTLAASIGLVYVGVVAGVGAILGTRGEPNLLLSLVATAAVALAFQPLRERLQRLANRLVYGQRATPYAVLAGFSHRIGSALSLDEVLPQMAEAAGLGVGAVRSRVRLYVPGGADRMVAWPPESPAADFERTARVFHHGEPVGEIAVSKQPGEPLTPGEAALLDDLAVQAGPAFSNVRLTEELRASRQRIVVAQDAERRHIERDLHDGAQQHLVALSVNLRILHELLDGDTPAARELLNEIQTQATDALVTLRDLARGIYPPALVDRGIVAALEGHLAKSRQGASLTVYPKNSAARFAPQVEAAIYFCVLEALQNGAKHAPDAALRVRLNFDANRLAFEVTDNGQGFDPAVTPAGTGLHGMRDRLAAVGGSLQIRSARGAGTTIEGVLPVRLELSNE